MDPLTKAELAELDAGRGPCVSIYMPVHRKGDTRQDPVLLQNLLGEAAMRLEERGVPSPDTKAILAPARDLLGRKEYREHQEEGLALFLSPGRFRSFRLPLRFASQVLVGDRHYLRPLLPLLSGDGTYRVLLLATESVRLFPGSRFGLGEGREISRGPADAFGAAEPQGSQRRFHLGPAGAGGGPMQGHDAEAEQARERIKRHFRRVDDVVSGYLREERAPLVLAGEDYLMDLYREVGAYPWLLPTGIPGDPESLLRGDGEALHRQGWALVEPLFLEARENALLRYRELQGTGRASNALEEIVPNSLHGRTDVLFVAVDGHRWGSVRPETGEVSVHEEPAPGDEDLLDLAAVQTILHGGTVYALPSSRLPDGAPADAVFRY